MFSVLFVHHPSFSFRPRSASLSKDSYRGVGYSTMTTCSSSSSTTRAQLDKPIRAYQPEVCYRASVTFTILCLLDWRFEANAVVHKMKLMLWALPGCRGIETGCGWYILKFLGASIALLQTLHHLPTGVSCWLCSGMSPSGTLHILTSISPSSGRRPPVLLIIRPKLWGQLCSPPAKLLVSLWLLSCKAQCLAVCFSVCLFLFLSLLLWKLLWLGNWTYISILINQHLCD